MPGEGRRVSHSHLLPLCFKLSTLSFLWPTCFDISPLAPIWHFLLAISPNFFHTFLASQSPLSSREPVFLSFWQAASAISPLCHSPTGPHMHKRIQIHVLMSRQVHSDAHQPERLCSGGHPFTSVHSDRKSDIYNIIFQSQIHQYLTYLLGNKR